MDIFESRRKRLYAQMELSGVSCLLITPSADMQYLTDLTLWADEAYWKKWYEHRIVQMDDMDAFVAIRKDDNSFELSDVPAQKQKLYNSAACMPAAASLIVPAVRPG